jgi:hypothetical protein
MRKLALLTTIGVTALIIGSTPAQAKSKLKLEKCNSSNRTSCAYRNIRKGTTTLRFLKRHRHVGTSKSRRSVRRSAKYLIKYGRLQLGLLRPAHYYGWLCIHSREGSWNDDGAPYYGGLQMHEGWGGVHHANELSPMEQIRLAEREYRETGYSHAWLAGQWPNTYPPCADYF